NYGVHTRGYLQSGEQLLPSPEVIPAFDTIPIWNITAMSFAAGGMLSSTTFIAVVLNALWKGVGASPKDMPQLDQKGDLVGYQEQFRKEMKSLAIAFCKPLFAGGDHKWIELFQTTSPQLKMLACCNACTLPARL
ncbi:hypothetical protein T492DRAFT_892444, partial [Pavlovales sp. CCMP2436]